MLDIMKEVYLTISTKTKQNKKQTIYISSLAINRYCFSDISAAE